MTYAARASKTWSVNGCQQCFVVSPKVSTSVWLVARRLAPRPPCPPVLSSLIGHAFSGGRVAMRGQMPSNPPWLHLHLLTVLKRYCFSSLKSIVLADDNRPSRVHIVRGLELWSWEAVPGDRTLARLNTCAPVAASTV